VVGFKDELKR